MKKQYLLQDPIETDRACKAIGREMRINAGLRESLVYSTAAVLSDYMPDDTPEQQMRAAESVLSLIFFHPDPNPWGATPCGCPAGDDEPKILA